MAKSKEALLAAGMELFLTHSYQGTGINELLEKVGVPKGSFYHHFKSKESFALSVLECYREKLNEDVRQTLINTDLQPPKRILAFMKRRLDIVIESGFIRGCPFGSFGQELASISDTLRKPISDAFDAVHAHMTACIAEGGADGSIKKINDPGRTATFIISAIQGAIILAKVKRDRNALTAVQSATRLLILSGD